MAGSAVDRFQRFLFHCALLADELDQTLFSADAYTVASALQSQNAGTAVLQQALDQQRRGCGTVRGCFGVGYTWMRRVDGELTLQGCTTMLSLCGALVLVLTCW